jgi:hypothetical protein
LVGQPGEAQGTGGVIGVGAGEEFLIVVLAILIRITRRTRC